MKLAKGLFVSGALVLVAALAPRPAAACGGCFVTESESTQVSGHRMILSAGKDATTLWDQITYTGDPENFA